MTTPAYRKAKIAYTAMMADMVTNNLPVEGLRAAIRSLLVACPETAEVFEMAIQKYIQEVVLPAHRSYDGDVNLARLTTTQQTLRCMIGCGLCYEALPIARSLATQFLRLAIDAGYDKAHLYDALVSIDVDIVQVITALEKMVPLERGVRALSSEQRHLVEGLHDELLDCQEFALLRGYDYPFTRALGSAADVLGLRHAEDAEAFAKSLTTSSREPQVFPETFELNGTTLPRIFSGLWQLSSPAWGSASTQRMNAQLGKHVQSGFIAFDTADHYGDAELTLGRFRSAHPHGSSIFSATKYCFFKQAAISPAVVEANVTERCRRLGQNVVDMIQLHWQFVRLSYPYRAPSITYSKEVSFLTASQYSDPQYLDVLRYLAQDKRVATLGLCNFDTEHLEIVLQSGIRIHSNQVQFSLVDSRPTGHMARVCGNHKIKLLAYGSLCGGFLAEKWIGMAEPGPWDSSNTPSQRKYLGMIRSWGGWSLFQDLLHVLKSIGNKHSVSVSNVAIRWVLDFSYVGAVIVGVRMGVSEHTDENLKSLGWHLDEQDQAEIGKVLDRSRKLEMFDEIGDCGNEYR